MGSVHPHLNDNFFQIINTKEKAYWLGFLFADGCITIDKRTGSKRLHIHISKKDEWIINNFAKVINANINKILLNKDEALIRLIIGNKSMCDDLINIGCIPRKSKKLLLPKLENRSLYLAFLLGFFDGDGTQGTSKITTTSLKFLEQIKKRFLVKNEIKSYHSKTIYHELYLGAILFNEMLDNWAFSLPRKRIRLCTEAERIARIRKVCKGIDLKGKLDNLTRSELKDLIWKMPTTKIAKMYEVSDKAIEKKCRKFGIEKPSRGYWSKYNI